jgi:3-phenylpropionate/trans-cinnamate dioxygenase ferredoxin component
MVKGGTVMTFKKVGQADQIDPGQMQSFEVEGKPIVVVNIDGSFYAIDGRCSHMKGELAQGTLEGKIVTCPRHGAQFDVTSGKCTAGPKIGPIRMKTGDIHSYAVKIEDGSIMVDV